jgi:hypothetical protein
MSATTRATDHWPLTTLEPTRRPRLDFSVAR